MKVLALTIAILGILTTDRTTAQDCAPPQVVFNARFDNLFTPEQEMYLGDAIIERVERDYRVLSDAEINAFIQGIADRLAKHLPQTGIKYRVVVADVPDTNAFAIAGGRIFITRKMVSFVRNEDELAGVIGHELGHAAVRHGAVDFSRYFRELLGVSRLGDRRDVFEKYNRFIEMSRTKRVSFSGNHEDDQQLEADRIGVFAVHAAGYDANAMTVFWARLTEAKKRNSFFSFFGGSSPADKRLKEMVAVIKKKDATCVDPLPADRGTAFETWRKAVINFVAPSLAESLAGLAYKRQLQQLRPEIEHLRFSPDGAYILVQDSSTITILKRDPLSVVYRVEVEDATAATFSQNSKEFIVSNTNLRIQRFNIANKGLVSTSELAIRGGYWQTRISPDGQYAACFKYNGDLVVYDVATNAEIFEEKEFYIPTAFEVFFWQLNKSLFGAAEAAALRFQYSPDSRYLLAGRKGESIYFYGTRRETIAIDLSTRKTVSVGENIKKLLVGAMDFMSKDKVIGIPGTDIAKAGIFSFPSGDRLDQFELGGLIFTPAESGNYVAVRPVKGAAVGIYDLSQKKFLLANRKWAMDVYGDSFVVEQRNGEVSVFKLATRELVGTVQLPPSPLFGVHAVSMSPDGKWLTLSERSRGAVWNLTSGQRIHHVRSFNGSHTTPNGNVLADFPKLAEQARTIAVMDSSNGTITPQPNPITEENVNQIGPYLLVRRSAKPQKTEKEKEKEKEKKENDDARPAALPSENTTFELRNVETGGSLWKREFTNETPLYFANAAENTMGFYWRADSKAAKEIVDRLPALREKHKALKNSADDWMVQVIDPATGVIKGHILLETGEGSFYVDQIDASGDLLVVNDDANRVLVYSMSTGDLRFRFFGSHAVLSAESARIAVENSPGRVTVYDLTTGTEVERLTFARDVSIMRFLQQGKNFFVLSTDQIAYMFVVTKLGSRSVF